MIKVLVADNDAEFNFNLSKFLSKEEDIKVVDMTLDGDETLTSYYAHLPDVLILNMNTQTKNGVKVLSLLNKSNENERFRCNIILISDNSNICTRLNTSRVYNLLSKSCEFSEILYSIRETYKANFSRNPNDKENCEKWFLKLGFNLSSNGTKLLIKSILMLKKNNTYTFNMYDTYQALSAQENISPKKIKWNIEKSIDSMFRFSDKATIKEVFPSYDDRKPTPKYLIALTLFKLHH